MDLPAQGTTTYWNKRWEIGKTGWHLKTVNPCLLEFSDRLLKVVDAEGTPRQASSAFVPLCGKTVDLCWFREHVGSVVGVDGSELAASAFFSEQNLDSSLSTEPATFNGSDFKHFSANGISIYCGDYFSFEHEAFDCIFDRGSLVAILPEHREEYTKKILSLLKPGGNYFLVALEFDQSKVDGPPYAVIPEHMDKLFGSVSNVKVESLGQRDRDPPPGFANSGVTDFKEHYYLITKQFT